jgi:hypothetical protein
MQRLRNDVIKINKDIVIFSLTKGKQTIIDRDDYEKIMDYKWIAHKCKDNDSFRVRARKLGTFSDRIYLHRLIMNVEDSNVVIDHKNHNQLDNRKCNLRICTKSQNNKNQIKRKNNTSGFKGVSYSKIHNKFEAYIKCDYKYYYLGLYETKEEAARVYDHYASILFGEFALLNFKE